MDVVAAVAGQISMVVPGPLSTQSTRGSDSSTIQPCGMDVTSLNFL